MQDIDQVEGHTPDDVGPADPFEEFSDEEDWSMDWNDPNDRGFKSDGYDGNDQDKQRIAIDDPNNVKLPTDTSAAIQLE